MNRRRSRSWLDLLRAAPQALQTVEQTRPGREHVDDEVEVVDQNPFGSIVALDMRRLQRPRRPAPPVMPSAIARICRALLPEARMKVVGEPAGLSQIEDDEIQRLLVFGGGNRDVDLLLKPPPPYGVSSTLAMQPACRGVSRTIVVRVGPAPSTV